MLILYFFKPDLSTQAFHDILIASRLAERRPVNDPERLERFTSFCNEAALQRSYRRTRPAKDTTPWL